MTRIRFLLFPLLLLVGCDRGKDKPQQAPPANENTNPNGEAGGSLADARKGFATKLVKQEKANEPVDNPPPKVFLKVEYDAPVGKCAAYLTPDPKDGQKRPAIVWITGGDCNTIGDVWSPMKPNNDQTARQYRDAKIVMMFPSLRGGNMNPGYKENFLGEVDDVIAAAEFLAKQPYVDPNRIYLGGHSTGGTLVMLVAASTDRFRAVFSFGPAHDIRGYGGQFTEAVNMKDEREVEMRSPGRWVHSIKSPTFVFEGTVEGNIDSLLAMKNASKNPKAHFYPVPRRDHFSILAPTNRLIAQKILKDDGPETNITFTEAELGAAPGS